MSHNSVVPLDRFGTVGGEPSRPCAKCRRENDGCHGGCHLAAFIYDPALTDQEKAQMLKHSTYDPREDKIKIPAAVATLL